MTRLSATRQAKRVVVEVAGPLSNNTRQNCRREGNIAHACKVVCEAAGAIAGAEVNTRGLHVTKGPQGRSDGGHGGISSHTPSPRPSRMVGVSRDPSNTVATSATTEAGRTCRHVRSARSGLGAPCRCQVTTWASGPGGVGVARGIRSGRARREEVVSGGGGGSSGGGGGGGGV